MTAFQYAIAKAACGAHYEAKREAQLASFDELNSKSQRAWLAAAQAVLDTVERFASGEKH